MNLNKMLFSIMLIFSTLITLSSNNWLSMWMGLEMNLMSFIPLIYEGNKTSSQAMMTYFLTQALSSMMLLFSMLINPLMFMMLHNNMNKFIMLMMSISIMIKLGAAPFHAWLPEMMANLSWMKCMILMTWQKIAPLFLLSNTILNEWFLYLTIFMCTLVGGIGGLNQTSLRKIMAYSSINHLGWMLMFMMNSSSWYKYLFIYSILVMMVCSMMKTINVFFMNQLILSSPSMMEKYTYSMTFLSLGGLPPFLGFLPKWMVIQTMIASELYLIMVFMMLMSLLTLFYYMRLVCTLLMNYSTTNKWMLTKSPNMFMLFMFLLTNLMLPTFMVMGFF
nr:NADH dehydrogenase subunit 2 [Petillopsis calcar]